MAKAKVSRGRGQIFGHTYHTCVTFVAMTACSQHRVDSAQPTEPRTNTKLAKKAFSVADPSACDVLFSRIRSIDSKRSFCKQLKTYLFSL